VIASSTRSYSLSPSGAPEIDAGYFEDLGVNTLWVTVPVKNEDTTAFQGTGGDNHYYSGYHGYWPKIDSDVPTSLSRWPFCQGERGEMRSCRTPRLLTRWSKKSFKPRREEN